MIMFSALLYGTSYAIRKIGQEGMGLFYFTGLRFFAAFIFVISVLTITHARSKKINRLSASDKDETHNGTVEKISDADLPSDRLPIRKQVKGGIIGGLALVAGAFFQQWGLMSTVVGKAGFVTSLYMFFVPLITWIVLKKKIKKQIWVGAAIAFVGLTLISFEGEFELSKGVVAIFISAIFFAVRLVIVGQFVTRSNPFVLNAAETGTATVISLIFSLIFEHNNTIAAAINGWFPLLYCGFITLGLAGMIQFSAQKKTVASVTAIILSFESVFAAIFGMILLREHLNFQQTIGCLLIFVAVLISQYEKKSIEPNSI